MSVCEWGRRYNVLFRTGSMRIEVSASSAFPETTLTFRIVAESTEWDRTMKEESPHRSRTESFSPPLIVMSAFPGLW